MKRGIVLGVVLCSVWVGSIVWAEQRYPLGWGNGAVKVDYFRFTDSDMKNLDLENGVYVGVEGYVSLLHPNLYFGLEAGWARTSGGVEFDGFDIDLDVYYVPIEFNIKYVLEINPCLTIDVGGGGSANYFNVDAEGNGLSGGDDDWIWGGQLFGNVNYKLGQWFLGANVKYQFTDFIDIAAFRDMRASNFRAGAQVGFMF